MHANIVELLLQAEFRYSFRVIISYLLSVGVDTGYCTKILAQNIRRNKNLIQEWHCII